MKGSYLFSISDLSLHLHALLIITYFSHLRHLLFHRLKLLKIPVSELVRLFELHIQIVNHLLVALDLMSGLLLDRTDMLDVLLFL